MLRRDILRLIAAGSAVSVVGCARSAPTPAPARSLPADVRPYRLPRAPRPVVLPHPSGTFPLAPKAPKFPYFDDRDAVIRDARGISDAFERYIRAWFDGRVLAEIPREFLPKGMNETDYPSARLVHADDITRATPRAADSTVRCAATSAPRASDAAPARSAALVS